MFSMFTMVEVYESCVFYHIILVDRGRGSPAMRKIEHYSVQKVTGDGRCLFRALVTSLFVCLCTIYPLQIDFQRLFLFFFLISEL